MSDDAEIKQAYEELDSILRRIVILEGVDDGMLTDWLVLGAVQSFTEDGDTVSMVVRMLPERGSGVPYYRVLGLLDAGVKGLCMDLGDSTELDDEDGGGEALG